MPAAHDSAPPDRQPVIVDWGVIAPTGEGRVAFGRALRAGSGAVAPEDFPGLGPVPVGRIPWIADVLGEDRAITLLRRAFGQLAPSLGRLFARIPSDRRGVCAATSKGALMLYLQDPARACEHWADLGANAPATFLMRACEATGPVQAYMGACATGLTNILRAADSIADGWCDMAVAGSAEATLHPLYLASFLNLGAHARGGSHPFDARHHGFVAGEGAALFVLASRAAAERAGLAPIAHVAGSALGADAFHPVGIESSGASIASVGRRALRRAGWNPEQIDFLDTHGTATVANDTAEANAIRLLLGDSTGDVAIHAFKSSCGHLMGAAGAVELAACLAAIEGGFIPPTDGFQSPATGCEHLRILRAAESRPVQRVLTWSFGFGGHLVAAAIERG